MNDTKSKTTDKKQNMTTGNPGRALLFFAIPMILGNLLQQFYNTVDSIIVGRFVGEDALAAVGASYSLTTVFVMVAIGGGIGASVITAQYLGAREYGHVKTSIFTALLTFLSISIVLALFGFAANRAILTALKTPANILDSAVMYLQIYFLGLPFLFMYNILTSIFNALGESKVPLYLLIFSSVTNIVLDLLAVGVLGWGVAGAAAATVFAQGLAAVILFCLLMQKIRGLEEARVPIYDRKMLAKMVKVAVPSILQQSIVSIGMLLVQSVVNGFGSSVLAGYSAGTRIESICVVPMIALGNAVSTFTAQNIGAGKPERVKEGYRAGYVIVGVFAVVLCLALVLGKNPIISAFVDAEDGRLAFETGTGYLSFIAWFFALIGLKALTDGVLRGSGDVVVFTIANLCNLAVRVFVAFRFAPIWGVQAVWFAVPMGWCTNYVISFVRYLTGKWSKRQLI